MIGQLFAIHHGKQGLLLVVGAFLLIVAALEARTATPAMTSVAPHVPEASAVTVVHYFPPQSQGMHVGHVSMTLADGTYISWVPQYRRLVSPVAPNRTLAADVSFEEESAIDFPVENLNTDQMKAWWEQFRQTNTIWAANGPNCTTVVEAGLKAGGARGIPSSSEVWFPLALLPTLEKLGQPGIQMPPASATLARQ